MKVDYDLVVIGTSSYAYDLVSLATRCEARVAWVLDRETNDTYLNIAEVNNIFELLKISLRDRPRTERLDLFAKELSFILGKYKQKQNQTFELVQTNGVDVIFGKCKFIGKYQNLHMLEVTETLTTELSIEFSKRKLSSRSYAIAHDISVPLSKIFGLNKHDYLTTDQLFHLDVLPRSIVILGGDSYACAIAQVVNFLGVHTSLITDSAHVLPNVDVEIARILQAQLESEGVEVYTSTKITAVSKIEHSRSKIWLEDITLECDRILVPLVPNEFYFPQDSHIYRCNSNEDVAVIMQQTFQNNLSHFQPIVKNLSFLVVLTVPPLAQVGITEAHAKKSYGKNIYIFHSSTQHLGTCKIICDRHGHILGASMFGKQSKFIIESIAIAMQGNIKVQNISLLQELEIANQWQYLHSNPYKRTKLKHWFNFRRDWTF